MPGVFLIIFIQSRKNILGAWVKRYSYIASSNRQKRLERKWN
jgi:hypothetical protein